MAKAKKETKEESTALVVLTPEEQAYMESVKNTPQGGTQGNSLNKLVVNAHSKDADGVKRPIGAWHITGTDKYFDGEVKFRPIRYANKLMRYVQDDSKKWQMQAESVYFKDFSEQIFDTDGGIALGRLFGRKYTDEQKAATRDNAEFCLDIFGLVQLGDEAWHPVLYRVRGSKLMKMLNAFKGIPKDKIFSEYAYKIETFQPDGKQYWDITVAPDLSTKLRITDILAFDKEILDFLAESNRQVMTAHMRHRGDNVANNFAARADKATIINDVELDDELPF